MALKQRLSLYRSYGEQIQECDREIGKLVAACAPKVDPDDRPLPPDRKQKQRRHRKKSGNPDFNMRPEAYKLFGVDLTQIPGLTMLVLMLFQRSGAGHVEVAHGGALRLVAGVVPGQRHQRG